MDRSLDALFSSWAFGTVHCCLVYLVNTKNIKIFKKDGVGKLFSSLVKFLKNVKNILNAVHYSVENKS